MRGAFEDQGGLFSYISSEAWVPAGHPLRKLRELVRAVLGRRGVYEVHERASEPSAGQTAVGGRAFELHHSSFTMEASLRTAGYGRYLRVFRTVFCTIDAGLPNLAPQLPAVQRQFDH